VRDFNFKKTGGIGDDLGFSKALESESQGAVRRIVKSLPEDTPSLHWRSSLNERILALGPVKKGLTSLGIALRALAGAGLVGALALSVVFWQARTDSGATAKAADGKSLAATLITEHRDSVESGEIAGPGISGNEQDGAFTSSSFDRGQDSGLDAL